MKYSIIIITHNRNDLLRNCLESIAHAKHQKKFEVIVIINGVSSGTEEVIADSQLEIKSKTISETTPAQARNIAISISSYDFLCFLDDDVITPENYFVLAGKKLNESIAVLGGPDQTYPNSTFFEKAIGETLKSPLATGSTRHRHKSIINSTNESPSEKNFILCNLWINKTVLNRNKLTFDSDFYRNEENVLLHHLENENMLYMSELFVYHKRKGKLSCLIKAVSKSGFYRVKSFYKFPSSFSLIYLLPLLAFCFFAISSFSYPIYSKPLVTIYLVTVFMFSLRLKNILQIPCIFIIHIIIHCSYCFGLIGGVILNLPCKLRGEFSN